MNSFVNYKSMLGITDIDSDIVKVDVLAADTVIANELQLPNGAIDNYVLKSDADGNASWKPIILVGDVIGGERSTINTTKWIGQWAIETDYLMNNMVTHNHVMYKATENNIGVEPMEGSIWEVVINDREDTVYEAKSQPITNKTNIETLEATVSNKLKLPAIGEISFGSQPYRYLVGVGTGKDEARWVTDLAANQLSVRNGMYYYNEGRAEAGKVLTCIGNTGLCDWEYPSSSSSVSMAGDVTGMSNTSVVNTLAGGTIQVSDLLTAADLPSDIVLEDKAQPLRNKTEADIVDLTINNSLKLNLPTIASGVFNIRYLVGWQEPGFNDCRWVEDLHAKAVGAHDQFLYPAGGSAAAGKILSCVDATGLAEWITPPSTAVTMSGDVTGTSDASVVNTLAGGTIAVNQLVRKSSVDTLTNKTINDTTNNVYANGLRNGSSWSVPLTGPSPTQGMILGYNGSAAAWSLPPSLSGDVTGAWGNTSVKTLGDGTISVYNLITSTGNQGMINKLMNDASNDISANRLRNGNLWNVQLASGAPANNSVLSYNGQYGIWAAPSSLVTLAGDVTGPATNCVVSKATTDFAVGRTISTSTGDRRKKVVVHEEGTVTDPMDHRFHGLGVQPFQMRYQVSSTSNAHVFYAATSATTSNELVKISGVGDMTVARTLSTGNVARTKKITVYDEGVLTDPTDHRFMGLGVQAFQMRYQTPTTGHDHVFYAATSATTSNEVFRVSGVGNVISSAKASSATSQAWGWINPTNQGAYTGWNRSGSSGRTTFANQQGGGGGGWEWVNYNGSNAQTPSGNPSMSLDRDGNLTVRGRVISEGVPDGFSANWWSPHDAIQVVPVPTIASGAFANLRPFVTSINYSAWTIDGTGIFLPVAGYFRISYRFKMAAKEKTNMMLCCDVSIGGTNHPSLYTFDMGLTYQHDLHCEAIINISAPNMWVSYPKLTLRESTPKDFDLYTGHFTIEKLK